MEIRKEFNYNPIGSWNKINPYTMAFVYPKDETPYMIKGGYEDVETYLKNIEIPAIVHYTLWHHKTTRRIIKLINCGKINIAHIGGQKNGRWEVSSKFGKNYKVIVSMRKLPRKWIKEIEVENPVPNKIWRKIVL